MAFYAQVQLAKLNSVLIKIIARRGRRSCRNTHCSRYSLSSRMASVLFPWAFNMEILRFLAACRAESKQD